MQDLSGEGCTYDSQYKQYGNKTLKGIWDSNGNILPYENNDQTIIFLTKTQLLKIIVEKYNK